MKQFILISVFTTFLHICGTCAKKTLTDIIITSNGPVRGEVLTTVQNSSLTYAAFRGIPYAKPPIGQLRFKPPVEANSWSKTLIATADGAPCPQLKDDTDYIGDEDCLHLNIYTPKKNFRLETNELLAVMVWIHGGAFSLGDNVLGADFFMEENVIIVSINYRLGPLGFLSLNHPNATGNAGLKDQVLALKWVQRNIQYFGGDSAKITLFGQSAGAVAVELHKISDISRELFNRSIAMSGAPLNFWAFTPTDVAITRAFTLGKYLGVVTNDEESLLKKLYKMTPESIVRAATKVLDKSITNIPFTPTYEDPKVVRDDVFLFECNVDRYRARNFKDSPHILGFTGDETIVIAGGFSKNNGAEVINNIPIAKIFFSIFKQKLSDALKVIHDITVNELIRISTDLGFVTGIDLTQQYLSQGQSPIYYYRNTFDYESSLHRYLGISLNGTGHEDDVLQIFWWPDLDQSLDSTSDIAVQRKRMVKLWSNFAKYGNPTPNGTADVLLNITWTSSEFEGRHLEIGNNGFVMKPRPTDAIVKLLQGLFTNIRGTFNGCD